MHTGKEKNGGSQGKALDIAQPLGSNIRELILGNPVHVINIESPSVFLYSAVSEVNVVNLIVAFYFTEKIHLDYRNSLKLPT
jgi:hypothetical protein